MVGPRGGSPYVKRGGGRISKQQQYQQAIATQHIQASAYQQHQQQLQQQAHQQQHMPQHLPQHQMQTHPQHHHPQESAGLVPPPASANSGGKFADDGDEAGGMGDEMDLMSLREAAMIRYGRYHEWMELITSSAVPTSKFVAGAASTTAVENEAQSIYLNPINERMEAENKDKEKKALSEGLSERALFFKKATQALREEFGASTASESTLEKPTHSTETELFEKFGLEVISKFKLTPIKTSSSPAETTKASRTNAQSNQLDLNLRDTDMDDLGMQQPQYDEFTTVDTSQGDIALDTGFPENPSHSLLGGSSTPGNDLLRDDSLPPSSNDLDPDAFISLNPDNDSASSSALDLLDIPSGLD